MSQNVFPVLKGRGWSVLKTPLWSNRIQTSTSGLEVRAKLWTLPRYRFELTYPLLREYSGHDDMRQLLTLYQSVSGTYDTFLYKDLDDYSVTAQAFGTGTGSTQAFQLIRSYAGLSEPVRGVAAGTQIFINGTLQTSGYTISNTGLVTFSTAPSAGAALTWTGTFYYRCRFEQDGLELEQFFANWWACNSLTFVSVK
jgi:uncharacterized protein (TIGR02217 family)